MKDQQVISLFSGAGGMSLGFAQAGLKPTIAADLDADACETYRANLGVDAIQTDIADNDPKFREALIERRGAFALIGGPPCQGFSSAGRKDGTDKRNRLIFEYLAIVSSVSPRWFLFENVEGLLTSNRGDSLFMLVKEFIRLGYVVRLEKVNFAAYGLPQARKRVVLIGNRLGINFAFPTASHSFDAGKHRHVNGLPLAPSLNAALAGLGRAAEQSSDLSAYASPAPVNDYDALMRQGNSTGRVSLHVASVPRQLVDLISRLRPGETMKNLSPEFWHDSYRRRAFRRVMDGTPTERRGGAPSGIKRLKGELNALTITSAATREFIHPSEDRPLTVRECARLQSFPDAYSFAGNAMSAIRQIGNAFPPLAARVFAEHLIALDGSFGADVGRPRDRNGRLIGYRLTEAAGMSPALARTDSLLGALTATQPRLPFDSGMAEVA
jgi:DNA (cytosine-5)-methyltransferase 1